MPRALGDVRYIANFWIRRRRLRRPSCIERGPADSEVMRRLPENATGQNVPHPMRILNVRVKRISLLFGGWSQPIDATLYLRGKRWSVAMDRGFRRGFTTAEKTELWDRWKRGESLKA